MKRTIIVAAIILVGCKDVNKELTYARNDSIITALEVTAQRNNIAIEKMKDSVRRGKRDTIFIHDTIYITSKNK